MTIEWCQGVCYRVEESMFAFRDEAVKAWGELPRDISNALTVSSWTYVHVRTHNDKQYLPPTHVHTYTHMYMYLHTDTTLPSIHTYYTHLHHILPPMPHRYIRNAARTHTPGTHQRIHMLTYTHTHTHTHLPPGALHAKMY